MQWQSQCHNPCTGYASYGITGTVLIVHEFNLSDKQHTLWFKIVHSVPNEAKVYESVQLGFEKSHTQLTANGFQEFTKSFNILWQVLLVVNVVFLYREILHITDFINSLISSSFFNFHFSADNWMLYRSTK